MYQNLKTKLIYKYSLKYALKNLFGLNYKSINKINALTGIPEKKKIEELSIKEINNILNIINKFFIIELNLKKKIYYKFERIKELKNLKAIRFNKKLPVRGQRTHTNAKTCKRISTFTQINNIEN